MYFKDIIEKYGKGASDAKMHELTEVLSEFFSKMKHSHEEKYWILMRDVMGVLNDGHYDEAFAVHDVKNMLPIGEHWSAKQVEEATKSLSFPNGVNIYDKYVAFNAFANDLKDTMNEEDIIKAAYAFWFNDKDYKGKNKIWCYMKMIYSTDEK